MNFRRLVFLIFTLLFCANLLCLVISVLAPFINPKYFWPPALFGLGFKILFSFHVLFTLIYFLLRRRRFIIASVLGIFISFHSLFNNFAFHPFNNEEYNPKEKLRLMTYNCTSFGWFVSPDHENILDNIRSAKPDILCLQEYYKSTKKRKNIMGFLRDEMGYKYYYEYTTKVNKSKSQVGQAFFSYIPLHNFSPIAFENTANGASYVDIYLPGDTFRLINVHFESIRLQEKEYTLPGMEEVKDKNQNYVERVTKSLQKFRGAFRRRSYQASLVDSVIENSPYKVIVCGDFNDTPNSYLYNKISSSLNDTYLRTNSGIGSTFAGKLPGLRIDYILADPDIDVEKTYVLRKKGGQHYPLIADFNLDKPNENR